MDRRAIIVGAVATPLLAGAQAGKIWCPGFWIRERIARRTKER